MTKAEAAAMEAIKGHVATLVAKVAALEAQLDAQVRDCIKALAAAEAAQNKIAALEAEITERNRVERETTELQAANVAALEAERDKALADMDSLWKSDHLWSAAYSAVEEQATELWKQGGFPEHWEYPLQVAEVYRDRATDAEARGDALRQALQQYGQHASGCLAPECGVCVIGRRHTDGFCTYNQPSRHVFIAKPCSCGLAAVLAGSSP